MEGHTVICTGISEAFAGCVGSVHAFLDPTSRISNGIINSFIESDIFNTFALMCELSFCRSILRFDKMVRAIFTLVEVGRDEQ